MQNKTLLKYELLIKRTIALLFVFIAFSQSILAQQDSLNPKRLKTVLISEGVIYAGSMTGLYVLWYKDYPTTSFHFFNDNAEWLQMDKVGHGVTSYYIGKSGYEVLKWSGVDRKKAIWYGGSLGLVLQTTVEIFDGFSSQWGASWGDLAANFSGSGLFVGQQLLWDEQRILLKYSFHQSDYWQYRPNLLGENLPQNILKDYNGQTYWLSANIASFLGEETKFPKWLNFAIGYGADGMTGAFSNETCVTCDQLFIPRIRQYYVSLDVDLTRIKTKSKLLNTVFGTIGFIKIPFPTVEFNSSGDVTFKPLYF